MWMVGTPFRNVEGEISDISLEQHDKIINDSHVNAQNKLDKNSTKNWNRRHRVSTIEAIKQNEVILLKKKNSDLLAEIEKMKLEKVKAAMLGMHKGSIPDKWDVAVSSASKQSSLFHHHCKFRCPQESHRRLHSASPTTTAGARL